MNRSENAKTIEKLFLKEMSVMNEELLTWQTQLENEREALLQLQTNGDFTDEHAGRLLNIESMLEQIAINQFLS